MDLPTLIAQWSGKLPDGFVPPAVMRREPPQCAQPRCRRPASLKANGEYAKSCEPCRIRRAKSCKRRRAALVAEGGCRRCAYRKRLEGDFLCARCREDRDIERAQKRQDAIDAAGRRRVRRAAGTRPPGFQSRPAACRRGTPARSRNRQPPTGRRCRTRSRAKSANGRGRCSRAHGAIGAADPAASPGRAMSRLRVPVPSSARGRAPPARFTHHNRPTTPRVSRAPVPPRSSAAPRCRSAVSPPSATAVAAPRPPAPSSP